MSAIFLNNVTKVFHNNMVGVKNVSLIIEKGEFVFLLGKSGAGKSTLVKLITRELEPTSGEILINDEKITGLSNKKLPLLRRKIGIVRQDFDLLESKTVYENIEFVMTVTENTSNKIKESVPMVLGMVGIRNKANYYPRELSGGERFRAMLARAIVNNPEMLIADEPTANLDPDAAWDIMCLLDEINRLGITVIVATHAAQLVNIMKKRVITLYHGKVLGDVKKGKYGDIV